METICKMLGHKDVKMTQRYAKATQKKAHPSSGDNIFYKVRYVKHIILLDSFRNEPKGMNARL